MTGGSKGGDDKAVYSMDVSAGGGVWSDAIIPDFKERSPGGGAVEEFSSGEENLPSSSHTMTEVGGLSANLCALMYTPVHIRRVRMPCVQCKKKYCAQAQIYDDELNEILVCGNRQLGNKPRYIPMG